MKRFLIIVSSVIALLYVLNMGLDYYVSMKLQKSPDRRYIGWNEIINEQLNADLVIMGNSRAWCQYDPYILDSILGLNCYNIGIDGSGLNRQILRYEIYEHSQIKKPMYILMNIDYFTASAWTIGYEREQFFPYMWNAYVRRQICDVEPFNWVESYVPIYRYVKYAGLNKVLHEELFDPYLYRGYKGQVKAWNPTAYNELTSYHCNFNERTIKEFDKFLAERRAEGIKIIFCHAPFYIGFTNKVDNLPEFYAFYKKRADEYDIPILDYTYSNLSMDTTYFYNASHLNKQGAELFTMKLAHDLDLLGIK